MDIPFLWPCSPAGDTAGENQDLGKGLFKICYCIHSMRSSKSKAEKQEHAKKREGKEMLAVDASKDRIMDDFFFSHKLS